MTGGTTRGSTGRARNRDLKSRTSCLLLPRFTPFSGDFWLASGHHWPGKGLAHLLVPPYRPLVAGWPATWPRTVGVARERRGLVGWFIWVQSFSQLTESMSLYNKISENYKTAPANCNWVPESILLLKLPFSMPLGGKFRKVLNTKVVRLGKTSPTEVESRQSEFVWNF